MEYMFLPGFLGTRAQFFMDVVTVIVAILPFLVSGSIYLAKMKMFRLHALTQNIIFIVSVIVVGYFEYGVRVAGGFNFFVTESGVSHTYASIVMILHISIAVFTFLQWTFTIIRANYQFAKKEIPGYKSRDHIKFAIRTYLGIIATSFSGIWVYVLLFVY